MPRHSASTLKQNYNDQSEHDISTLTTIKRQVHRPIRSAFLYTRERERERERGREAWGERGGG